MSFRTAALAIAVVTVSVASCDDGTSPAAPDEAPSAEILMNRSAAVLSTAGDLAADLGGAATAEEAIGVINDGLAARGAGIALQKIEWVTDTGGDEAGQTVFANDRSLRLPSRWVPADARRDAVDNRITQLVFQPFALANGAIDSEPAVDASFDTWNGLPCTALEVAKVADSGQNPSAILTLGGVVGDPFLADITTFGFLPGAIFDLVLGEGASSSVLGVTFTFSFVDPVTGVPTDIDSNGRTDTALKEVWYNDAFAWSTSGVGPEIDIETVALHENGHALELGHFGRVAVGEANNRLHVSPRAVMNAFILGTLREPISTDKGAFCSNFSSWPR